MHAKLLLLRFAPETAGGPGVLRVCIGSANLYQQWEHSRGACAAVSLSLLPLSGLPPPPHPIPHHQIFTHTDVLWIQDFPTTAAAATTTAHSSPPPPLPAIDRDRQALRRTLRSFLGGLFRALTAPLEGGLAIEKRLQARLAACLAGADLSDARATALASVPVDSALPNEWNGIHGLGTALGKLAWPQAPAAAAAPVTCMAGSLGNPADRPWLDTLTSAVTGRGAHGALPSLDGPAPGLRIMCPTNAIAFRCVLGGVVDGWMLD